MRPVLPAIVVILLGMLSFDRAGAQVVYPDFSRFAGLQRVGNADIVSNRFRLTQSGPNQKGAFWAIDRQQVGHGFTTRFRFRITNPLGDPDVSGERGGDGFAFVIQTSGNRAVGETGGQLGYHGINKYVAIEFDTYLNTSFLGDPLDIADGNGNHISVQPADNRSRSSLGSITPAINLSDGIEHEVVIEYLPGTIRVYLDGCNNPVLTAPLRLENYLTLDTGRAWVGFSAATGTSWENHDILSWYFNPALRDTTFQVALCAGSTALLQGPKTAARHLWSNGATTPSLNVDRPGTYWVDLDDTIGCTTTAPRRWTYIVTARELPQPRLSPSGSITSCGGSVLLSAPPGFSTYRWSNDARGQTLRASSSGKYWVQVVDEYGCTAVSDTVTVRILEKPPVRITALDPIRFCQGDSVRLDAGPGFASYNWSTGETTRSIVVRKTGSIRVTVTDTNGCDSTTPPTVISVVPTPSPTITVRSNGNPCRADSVILDAGIGYSSYLWSTGETTQTIVVTNTSTVTVTVTNTGECEGTSPPVMVTIGSELPPPDITADGPLTICDGARRRLSAPEGFASYQWNTGESTPSIEISTAGTYTVSVVDAGGCEAVSLPVTVTIVSPPALGIMVDGDTLICAGDSRTLSASPGFESYIWSNGATERVITVVAGGRYSVSAIDANGCTAAAAEVSLIVGTPLSLSVAGDTTICVGQSVSLAGEPSGGIGAIRYEWSPAEGLSCTDCRNPVASPITTTRYTLQVFDQAGCSVESALVVAVNESPARVNAAMAGSISAYAGRPVVVPIDLQQSLDAADVREMILTLRYSGSPLRFKEILMDGTLTAQWVVTELERDLGVYRARISTAPTGRLSGTGRLIDLSFDTFLGSGRETDISFELELPGVTCTQVRSSGTIVTIDSTCGIDLRLIESSAHRYSLSQNIPNPVSSATRIPFSIGLDGNTRVEIFDGAGVPVALLVAEHLQPGSYEVTWDAGDFPSGVYTCRLASGVWSATSRITIVR